MCYWYLLLSLGPLGKTPFDKVLFQKIVNATTFSATFDISYQKKKAISTEFCRLIEFLMKSFGRNFPLTFFTQVVTKFVA